MILLVPSEEAQRALSEFRCLACRLPLSMHTPQELASCRNYLHSTVTYYGEGGGQNPLAKHSQSGTGC